MEKLKIKKPSYVNLECKIQISKTKNYECKNQKQKKSSFKMQKITCSMGISFGAILH